MPSNKSDVAQFILLPMRGLRDPDMTRIDAAAPRFVAASSARLRAGAGAPSAGGRRTSSMKVVHSLHEDGPKLVEMGPSDIAALRVSNPGVKAVPVVKYDLARTPRLVVKTPASAAAGRLGTRFQVTVVDAKTKKPLKGAQVVAFAAQALDRVAHALVAQVHADARAQLATKALVRGAVVIGAAEQRGGGLLRLRRGRRDQHDGGAAECLHRAHLTAQVEAAPVALEHHQDQIDAGPGVRQQHLRCGHRGRLIALSHAQLQQLLPLAGLLCNNQDVLKLVRPQRCFRNPR